MAAWLRVAGRGQGVDGRSVAWSVSEGSRGRRWREVRRAGEGIAHSLLLETDPDGRFAHLELSTPSGLLTLHPEGDGTLHGHAIVSDGVEHVGGLPWEPDGLALVEGSTVCVLAAAALLRESLAPGSSRAHHAVVVPPTLWLEVKPIRIGREDGERWKIGSDEPLEIDRSGLPVLGGGEIWPLEAGVQAVERHR